MTLTFEQIYKKYYRIVYNTINKTLRDEMLSEELTNDVMINVHKALQNPSKAYNEEKGAMSTWIVNIAKNRLIDELRKRKLNTMSLDNVYVEWMNGEELPQTDHLYILKDNAENPEDEMIKTETMNRIRMKFDSLNEVDRKVASMHYFDGLSYEEVSKELNMPLGTVKAKLHHARMTMMEALPSEMRKVQSVA